MDRKQLYEVIYKRTDFGPIEDMRMRVSDDMWIEQDGHFYLQVGRKTVQIDGMMVGPFAKYALS